MHHHPARRWAARRWTVIALLLFTGFAATAGAAPQLRMAPLGFQVTNLQAVPGQPRTYDVTWRGAIANQGDPAVDVTARVTSLVPHFIVLDGELSFGDVAHTSPLRPARSHDTFTLRVTAPRILSWPQLLAFLRTFHTGLSWQISCANCGGANRPPVANAGPDQSVYAQQIATLDGSASSDPDGDPLTYEWTLLQHPTGSQAALGGAASVHPTLTPDRDGDYLVQLVVRDGHAASAPDTVIVSTLNSAPVANAGPDRTAFVMQRVTLDGSGSSDVDGDPLTFVWQLVQRPAGSSAELERPDEVNPAFTPDLPGEYIVELVVDDGTVSSTPDTAVISTANSRPVARAGADQSATVGSMVTFDGTASSDVDGDPLSYRWSLTSRPANSAAALQGETTAQPTLAIDRPGTYIAQLIVNDGQLDSDADTVSVSTLNSAPVAVAGADQSVHFGATVQLNGAASSDPDGDPLGFDWALLSTPQGSAAAFTDPNLIAPQFVADLPGLYVAQLIVSDGVLSSAPSSVTVTAGNEPPVAVDDSAATAVGVAVTVNVLANDHDPDPRDVLRIDAAGPAAHGAVTHTASTITYTPAAGYTGDDSLSYRISDGAATASATLRISVTGAANRPPVADAGADQTVAGGAQVGLSGALSSDPDGDALTYLWAFVSRPPGSTAGLQNATSANPGFTADRRGVYEVSLTVDDGHSATDTDTVSITAENRAPVAQPDAAATAAGTPVTIDVLANDSDADGDTLTITAVSQPAAGTAAIVGGGVTFMPAGAGGDTQTFMYTINDANGGSATAQVTVTIAAALPTLSIDDVSVGEGDAGTGTVAFLVTLSAASASAVTVQFATADSTATSPADYVARSGELTIPAGETSAEIEVTVVGDTVHEQLESFRVLLSNALNAALADGEGEGGIVDDDPGGPTSVELINAALAAGTIDDETALLYKVYAEFSDSRLPAAYQSSEPPGWEGHTIREASRRFATLSPPTQALLAPFLEFPQVPPSQGLQGLQRARLTRHRAGPIRTNVITNYVNYALIPGMVFIGWDGDSPLAAAMEEKAAELQAEFGATIWPKLTQAFGVPEPGSRIFILLDVTSGPTYEDSSDCRLARIWLRRYERYTFAHELTHALIDLNLSEGRCNDTEKLWMHEATATWAQHLVYPARNTGFEQHTAPLFLKHPDHSLNTHDQTTLSPAYGAYLWFLRIAGRGNDPTLVRDAWERAAAVGSLNGIDASLQTAGRGGFEKEFPLFAADNWNRHAPHRKYYEWDRMDHKPPQTETTARLAGNGWEQIELTFDLPKLSAKYQRVTFDEDSNIRTILFMNASPDRSDKARVHAIVKVRGQPWAAAEDWTKVEEKAYCRDVDAEDIEEIVFVFTNVGHLQDAPSVQDEGNYALAYSGLPCDDWTGGTTYRVESRAAGAVEVTTAVGTNLRFRVDTETNRGVWRAIEGSVSVQYDATSPFEDGTCTSHASTTHSAIDQAQITMFPMEARLDLLGAFLAVLPDPPTLSVTMTCTSSSGTFTVEQNLPWFGESWFYTGPDLLPVAVNPSALTGEYSASQPGTEARWTWNFSRAP